MKKVLHWAPNFGNSNGGGEINTRNILNSINDYNQLVLSDAYLPQSKNIFQECKHKIIFANPPNITVPRKISFPISLLTCLVREKNKKNIYKKINPDLNIVHGFGLFNRLFKLYYLTGIDLIENNYFIDIKPRILDIHGLMSTQITKRKNRVIMHEKKIINQFDIFIGVDQNIVSYIKKIKPNSEIYFIPSSPRDYFFNNIKKKKYSPIMPTLGFVGRYAPERGIPLLIQFVNRYYKNFKFILIFSIDHVNQKKEIIKKFPKFKNIEIYYNIENNNLPELYKKMDYLLNPVLVEGISRVTLEAMASKVVPIMINKGNRYPLIDSKTGLLIDEKNINKLIIRIKETDLKEYHVLSENAYNICKNEFSNSITIPKIKNIFKTYSK